MKKARKMTEGTPWKLILLFALPLMAGHALQQLYNTVDFIFVGNVMDKTAAAAVGASSTLINVTIGLFTGISVGTTVVASQAIGSGRDDIGRKALHTSVAFGLAGGLLLMVLGEIFAPGILTMLNTPASVLPQAVTYIRLYLVSLPMLVFYNMVTGVINGLQTFGSVYLLTNGGPQGATTTLVMLIYNRGIGYHQMGIASAIAWFLFAITMILTLISFATKKWVYTEDGK